jgi:uncharacterized membrane protein (UPF0127 family)
MVSRTRFTLSFLIVAVLGMSGCDGQQAAGPAEPAPFDKRFKIGVGERFVKAQVALTRDEQSRGLMGRTQLGENEGMFFVFSAPQRLSFWMRNTPLPLDIGYFDGEGVLREIYPMFPFDEKPVESVREDLMFALEMRRGWFRENGVRPGDRIDLAALRTAIRERGFPHPRLDRAAR